MSIITAREFQDNWMPYHVAERILPRADRRMFDNFIRAGYVQLETEAKGKSGRGKARLFSVANCIELATLWSLVTMGYKPSALAPITKHVVERALKLISSASEIDEILFNEHPMLLFYDWREKGAGLRALTVPKEELAAWLVNPNSKEARGFAKAMEQKTGAAMGLIEGFFVFEADYTIRRVLEYYLEVRAEPNLLATYRKTEG